MKYERTKTGALSPFVPARRNWFATASDLFRLLFLIGALGLAPAAPAADPYDETLEQHFATQDEGSNQPSIGTGDDQLPNPEQAPAAALDRAMIDQTRTLAVGPPVTPPPPVANYQGLFWLVTCLLAAALAGPRIFQLLNEHYDPWKISAADGARVSSVIRTEEEAFAKFMESFRVSLAPKAGGSQTTAAVPTADALASEFDAQARTNLVSQRNLLRKIDRETSAPARQKMLASLRAEMLALKEAAGFPAALPVWQAASAMEGLLNQLTDKMGNVTPSALRTVAGGVDLLDQLCVPGLPAQDLAERPLKFLVVDDDLISRMALSNSLKKAFGQPDLAAEVETALRQTNEQAYDVIFLDVQMPGMDGFELCTKIRGANLNRTTPVVFVTGQSDFNARIQSTLSGGNELMGKPFLTFEIAVKAFTLALRGRLPARIKPSPAKPDWERRQPAPMSGNGQAPVASPVRSQRQPAVAKATAQTEGATAAFLTRAAQQLPPLRELCKKMLETADFESRQALVADGFLRINSLASKPANELEHPACRLCIALDGLLRKLLEKTGNFTPSALATVAAAVELLNELSVAGVKTDLATHPPVRLLVVDDDMVSRQALAGALQTVFEKPERAENGEAAIAMTLANTYDVIFLDVIMPGMDGYETCAKIRETAPNRETPVVFVTGQADLQAAARINQTGGSDLVSKPFLTAEIIVKTLTFALRRRLHP